MSTDQPFSALSPSVPDNGGPLPADLAALAASLQKISEALLAHVPARAATPQAGPAQARRPAPQGETRAFYFSPAALLMEKELLRKYRAQDFQGLLAEAHTLLVGLVSLMRSVPKEARVRGHVIASLGSQLEHACALMLRMRHVYEKVMPVRQ